MAQSSLINNVEGIVSTSEDVLIDPENTQEVDDATEASAPEASPLDELEQLLSNQEDAPDRMDLEQWKDIHGKFYASSIDGDDVYVWKSLKRFDYKSIAASGAMEKQETFENSVVRKCLLWPRPTPEFFQAGDAGTIPTLFKQIMHQSGFIPDDVALSMIRRV